MTTKVPISSKSNFWILLLFSVSCFISQASSLCGFPGAPAHSTVIFNREKISVSNALDEEDEAGDLWLDGTMAKYSCDRGFELLGPARRICGENGTWTPQGIPFCVLNVAAGKAPMQSSVAEGGIPQKAVDGSTSTFFDKSTCSLTEVEKAPWWYVNLLEPYMVQLVRVDFGQSCCAQGKEATIVVRVGNNRPDLGVNPICNRFTGALEEGRPLFLPCNPPMPGAFVSVHFEAPPAVSLSICETFVYTDQALPIERCPAFRDQPPGSTATYNGKCYIFYNQQPTTFQDAMEFCEARGGSLVDESNPALQGFLSWELWRRHKGDANGQYWLGAVRDRNDPKNWRWINGKPVSVSFWNLPGGNDDCARFDGTKGWLWSDTSCSLNLNYICQHRPMTCGKPEQPPNSTLIAGNYEVGSGIEYSCNEGHLLVGPSKRSCLPTGFYSEFPPVCRFLQCGPPADIEHGTVEFVNGTGSGLGFEYKSMIRYHCQPGYVMVGRQELMCDVDERWNGPPPRCEPVYCEEPTTIRNGAFKLSTNSTRFGTITSYYCMNPRYKLEGSPKLICQADGSWDARAPACRLMNNKELASLRLGGVGGPAGEPKIPPKKPQKPEEDLTQDEEFEPSDFENFPRRKMFPGMRPGMIPRRRRPPFDPDSDELFPLRPRPRPQIPANPDIMARLPTQDLEDNVIRQPIDNEIPDSANVQSNPQPEANVPTSEVNERETRQAQLNLGGIIALGVFGGFVFLAAIITTIVILIRRKDPMSAALSSSPSASSYSGSHHGGGGDRGRLSRNDVDVGDRDAAEMIVSPHHGKSGHHGHGGHSEKKHHISSGSSPHHSKHHHHHRHKHRRHRHSTDGGDRHSPE